MGEGLTQTSAFKALLVPGDPHVCLGVVGNDHPEVQTQIHLARVVGGRVQFEVVWSFPLGLGVVLFLRQGEKKSCLCLKGNRLGLGSRGRQDVLPAGKEGK